MKEDQKNFSVTMNEKTEKQIKSIKDTQNNFSRNISEIVNERVSRITGNEVLG